VHRVTTHHLALPESPSRHSRKPMTIARLEREDATTFSTPREGSPSSLPHSKSQSRVWELSPRLPNFSRPWQSDSVGPLMGAKLSTPGAAGNFQKVVPQSPDLSPACRQLSPGVGPDGTVSYPSEFQEPFKLMIAECCLANCEKNLQAWKNQGEQKTPKTPNEVESPTETPSIMEIPSDPRKRTSSRSF